MSADGRGGGGGGAVPGITGDGRWRERDSRGDKRVGVSLGRGGQEEEQVLRSVLSSGSQSGKSI